MDVKTEYQNIGIGYNLLKIGILEAKKMKINELYANINGNNIRYYIFYIFSNFMNIMHSYLLLYNIMNIFLNYV
jgi:hypothetical protein